MSNVPVAIDPMGSADIPLPAGYERVESVYKPVNCWWKTDIEARIGYDVTTDVAIDRLGGQFILFGTNISPTNNRIYYFWANSSDILLFGRGSISDPSDIHVITDERIKLQCIQSDNKIVITQNGESSTFNTTPYRRAVPALLLLGASASAAIPTGSSSRAMRIYDFKVVDIATSKLIAHFVPVRKRTSEGWEYGLWDTAARKELEKVGTMQA